MLKKLFLFLVFGFFVSITALSQSNTQQLIKGLRNDAPYVREISAKALGNSKDKSVIPLLKQALKKEKNTQVKNAIKIAIDKLSGVIPADEYGETYTLEELQRFKPILEKPVLDKGKNAATYYKKAFLFMKPVNSKFLKTKMQTIIDNGWKKDEPELENILAKNRLALIEFEKGALCEKCDFYFGKIYDNPITKPLPKYFRMIDLTNLVFLEIQWYIKNKNLQKAAELYLFLFTSAWHISQNKSLISIMVSVNINRKIYKNLKKFLETQQPSKVTYKKMLNHLNKIEPKMPSIVEGFESEKKDILASANITLNEIFNETELLSKYSNDEKKLKEAKKTMELFRLETNKSVNKHFNNIIKAAKSNSEKDWDYAISQYNKEMEELERTTDTMMSMGDIIQKLAIVTSKKRLVKTWVQTVILGGTADPSRLKKLADEYHSTKSELKELKQILAQKINQ